MISDAALSALVEQTGAVLVHSVWQFALVALVVSLCLKLLPGRRLAARYAICAAGMGLVAAAPVATYWSLPVRAFSQSAQVLPADAGKQSAAGAIDSRHDVEHTEPPLRPTVITLRPDRSPMPPEWKSWRDWIAEVIAPWSATLVSLWCCGVLVFAIRPLWSWHTLKRLQKVGATTAGPETLAILARAAKRLRLDSTPQVLKSTLVNVPLVVGYVRPVILLPAATLSGLSPSELEAILLHELTHIRRHDFLVNMMQMWLETLFFYHPAVWWLSHTLRCEREHCCDEMASQALGSRAIYGRALLKLEELRGPIPSLALGATQGSLLRRIERLASGGPSSTTRTCAAAVLLLALTVASALGWGLASAPIAAAQDDATRAEEAAAADGEMTPQERAVDLHRKAAQIDALLRFFTHAKAGTRTFKLMANPSDDPFENLVRSLDEPIVEEDWYRFGTADLRLQAEPIAAITEQRNEKRSDAKSEPLPRVFQHRLEVRQARVLTDQNEIKTAQRNQERNFFEWSFEGTEGKLTEWLRIDLEGIPLLTEEDVTAVSWSLDSGRKRNGEKVTFSSCSMKLTSAAFKRLQEIRKPQADQRFVVLVKGQPITAMAYLAYSYHSGGGQSLSIHTLSEQQFEELSDVVYQPIMEAVAQLQELAIAIGDTQPTDEQLENVGRLFDTLESALRRALEESPSALDKRIAQFENVLRVENVSPRAKRLLCELYKLWATDQLPDANAEKQTPAGR